MTYISLASDFVSSLKDYLMEECLLRINDECDTKIDLIKYM